MKKWLFSLLVLLGLSGPVNAESSGSRVIKISVLKSGELQLNGKHSSLNEINDELNRLKGLSAEVWYYREAAVEDPPQIRYKVLDLIVAAELPVSFSTKPDFSDYVDGHTGESKVRKER